VRPIRIILILAGTVLIIVLGALIIQPNPAQHKLEVYRQQLKQRGEKMTLTELIPKISGDELKNGGDLLAVGDKLGKNLINDPPVMRWISPGHALVAWAQPSLSSYETTNCWPEVIKAVRNEEGTLTTLHRLLKEPKTGYQVQFKDGTPVSFAHLAPLRKISLWLSTACASAMHERDDSNAWRNLDAGSELVSRVHMEPLLIDQLVRSAIVNVELSRTWEALQYPGWSDEQLKTLQQNWSSFNLVDDLEVALSVERLTYEATLRKIRSSYTNLGAGINFSDAPEFLGTNYQNYDNFRGILSNPIDGIRTHWRYRTWKGRYSYEEELCGMKLWQATVEFIRSARANDAFVPAKTHFENAATNILNGFPQAKEWFFPATADLPNLIPRILLKTADLETAQRMLVTAIALERYKLRQGRYPTRLADMTPVILQEVPNDFMDGKPLRYGLRDDGTFLLYSVGEDGKDDGGDASPTGDSHYTWYKMRDAVWPAPATAEEVKKYEAEQLKYIKQKPEANARKP
jgi:hypothetical protein